MLKKKRFLTLFLVFIVLTMSSLTFAATYDSTLVSFDRSFEYLSQIAHTQKLPESTSYTTSSFSTTNFSFYVGVKTTVTPVTVQVQKSSGGGWTNCGSSYYISRYTTDTRIINGTPGTYRVLIKYSKCQYPGFTGRVFEERYSY